MRCSTAVVILLGLFSFVLLNTIRADEPSLAERIAEFKNTHTRENNQFHDELRSLAKQKSESTNDEYMSKVSDANKRYNEYLHPAAKNLFALIKSNRANPDVVDGIILLSRDMSHSLTVDPELSQIILKDQITNPKLALLCFQLRYDNNDTATEAILDAVATKHPLREARAQAVYARGEYDRQCAREWGRPVPPEKVTALLADAEKQFKKVLAEYADVKAADGSKTLGDLAAISLSRVKNIPALIVGKPAPDFSGADLNGKTWKLSDFRGKAVAMVFWGSWCGPCMAMVPHERELFERMKDKPFVLLGVNCADPLEKAKRTAEEKNMAWTSLWDAGVSDGPIQSAYNVLHWPTVYVIDAQGIIRYVEVRDEALDKAVEELVAEIK